MNDIQMILIAWISIVIGGFAVSSFFLDRRNRRDEK
jgi:uncharacterized membrane protein YwzB